MSKQMNWRNARLSSKRALPTRDEADYRERDAAARWLDGHWQHKTFIASKPEKWKPVGKSVQVKSAEISPTPSRPKTEERA
jgi:hypothetical protein